MVEPALAAAGLLSARGIEAAVANARFVKPLDEELISELARRCGRVVTVEENAVAGGFGSAVEEMLQRGGITVPVLSLGLPDRFIEHGRREQLLAEIGLEPSAIADAVERFVASTTHSLAR